MTDRPNPPADHRGEQLTGQEDLSPSARRSQAHVGQHKAGETIAGLAPYGGGDRAQTDDPDFDPNLQDAADNQPASTPV